MRDLLFANAPGLAQAALLDYGSRAGLKVDQYQACLNSGKHLAHIQQDVLEAQRVGVTGTPTFFLGLTVPTSEKTRVVRVIKGAQPYAAFKQAIDSLLAPYVDSVP